MASKARSATVVRGTGRPAIYLRISQDRFKSGAKHEIQLGDCHAKIRELGLDPKDFVIFVDTESATNGNPREGFNALIASDPRLIVIWHFDRLVRRSTDLTRVIALDVNVHAAKAAPIDLSTPTGRLQARIGTAVAEFEGEHKSERQRAANLYRVEAGLPLARGRSFGFTSEYQHVDAEAAAIRQAYADYIVGRPLAAIAREWNAAGLRSVRGRVWDGNTLNKLLRRATNAGLVAYDGKLYDGAFPAIVDRQIWEAAQRYIIAPERGQGKGGGVASSLLTGIALCGVCNDGTTVRVGQGVEPKDPTGWRKQYRCGIGHLTRTRSHVDRIVNEAICARLSAPGAADMLDDTARPDIDALRAERLQISRELDELAAAQGAGEISVAMLVTASKGARARLATLDERMAHAGRTEILTGLIGIPNTRAVWDALPLHRRRGIVNVLAAVRLDSAKAGPVFDASSVHIEWHNEVRV